MKAITIVSVLVLVIFLASCEEPVSGESQNKVTRSDVDWPPKVPATLNLFDDKREILLGEICAAEYEKYASILNDEIVNEYINKLGNKLVKHSKRANILYTFKVEDTPTVNALALPGGRIYIFRGLIEFVDNESEFAAILAHEIAHIALKQQAQTISRQMFVYLGVTEVTTKEDIRNKLERLMKLFEEDYGFRQSFERLLGIQRLDEIMADKYGIWNLYDAGYNPRGMTDIFAKIVKKLEEERQEWNWEDFFAILFSSHPPTKDRINLLKVELIWMIPRPGAINDSPEFQRVKSRIKALK